MLKKCWICKFHRRRNVDVVSTSPYQCILVIHQCMCIQRKDNVRSTSKNFRRRSYVVFTLNARALMDLMSKQSSCAVPLLRFWGSDVAKNFNWGALSPFPSSPLFLYALPLFSFRFILASLSLDVGPPNISLWHLGKRCKLSQQSLERIPNRSQIWCILALNGEIW